MRTALGYIRVSSSEQVEGVSLDVQREKIIAYARIKEYELVDIITDDGYSAKNLNRPGITRILNSARKGEIDAIIVLKLDRIFRNTIDALNTTRLLEKWGIAFHSINENLDTQSALGQFFFTLLAAIGQMERQIISERTVSALQHKRTKGERISGEPPYGYAFDEDGLLVPDQRELELLKMMKKWKAEGSSYRSMAHKLMAIGVKTRRGTDFTHQGIYQILRRDARYSEETVK
ncbi:recombinase family protein [bacterium]|nr:recombinase family protein [bacterium]